MNPRPMPFRRGHARPGHDPRVGSPFAPATPFPRCPAGVGPLSLAIPSCERRQGASASLGTRAPGRNPHPGLRVCLGRRACLNPHILVGTTSPRATNLSPFEPSSRRRRRGGEAGFSLSDKELRAPSRGLHPPLERDLLLYRAPRPSRAPARAQVGGPASLGPPADPSREEEACGRTVGATSGPRILARRRGSRLASTPPAPG